MYEYEPKLGDIVAADWGLGFFGEVREIAGETLGVWEPETDAVIWGPAGAILRKATEEEADAYLDRVIEIYGDEE